jgi:predicted phosphate transport protein (TIGR00153 family)
MFTAREPFSAGDLRMSLFKKPSLSGLVRESPFVSIQEHMRTVFSCICLIPPLFDALYRKDLAQVHDFAAQIDQLETEADRIKTNFRLNTPKSLFLPVDREDLLDLIAVQDHLADTVEEIGQILCYRDMEVPEALKEVLDELLEGTMEISSEAKAIIEQLDELLEVGFNGLEVDKVSAMISGLRRDEHNIDAILHRLRRTMFTQEKELDPISVMFWYKLIDRLGSISDQAENIADRLLLFLSK